MTKPSFLGKLASTYNLSQLFGLSAVGTVIVLAGMVALHRPRPEIEPIATALYAEFGLIAVSLATELLTNRRDAGRTTMKQTDGSPH